MKIIVESSQILTLFSLVKFSFFPTTALAKCGTWATKECRGDTDIRYDPSVSSDLEDLDPLYKHFEGLWIGTASRYDGNLNLYEPQLVPDNPLYSRGVRPYLNIGVDAFWNITLKGPRYYRHDITVWPAPDPSFCVDVPGFSNSLVPDGICGINGHAVASDVYKSSSHEKLSKIEQILGTGAYTSPPGSQGYTLPLGDQTLYESTLIQQVTISAQNTIFSTDFNSVSLVGVVFFFNRGPGVLQTLQLKMDMVKVQNEEEFLAKIVESYDAHNITNNNRKEFTLPVPAGGGLVQPFPTEMDWATRDPELSKSPYKEESIVKTGVVVGFTVAGAMMIIIAIVAFYMMRIRKLKRSAQQKFALSQSVIDLSAINKINPSELTELFNQIDNGAEDGGNGVISMEELRRYIDSNEDTKMTQNEFDVLFASVDLDRNGEIAFTEFCAFIGELTKLGSEEAFNDD